ncbi:MAG: alpha/beta hydrolase [Chlamydiae bacterium]|nr:alpha/beta hydrolase [Chlamydiota bacterium]
MGKIRVGDVELYYEQEGKGEPLVLISGYTTDVSAWALVRQELARHFSLLMLDNRGAGRSDCPDTPYTVDTMAEDVRGLLASLKLDKMHVLGHSMGGAIAQTLCFKYPMLIKRLILSNTLIRFHEVPAYALRYFFKRRCEGMSPTTMREGALAWGFSGEFLKNEEQIASLLKKFEAYPYGQTLIGQKRQLEALLQFDSGPWFQKITHPTLVIEGEKDILCPEDSKRLAKELPRAKLVSFAGQGHMPHVEKSKEFVEEILKFLKT